MKILNNQKIAKTFHKLSFREMGANPLVDWSIILIISILIIIFLIINSIHLFNRVNDGGIDSIEAPATTTMVIFDTDGLDYLFDRFDSKSKNSSMLLKNYDFVSDPSI